MVVLLEIPQQAAMIMVSIVDCLTYGEHFFFFFFLVVLSKLGKKSAIRMINPPHLNWIFAFSKKKKKKS